MTQSFTWSNGDRPYPRDGSPNFAVPLKEEDAGNTHGSCIEPTATGTHIALFLTGGELVTAPRDDSPHLRHHAWIDA